jgi:hypothetical protein
MLGHRDGFPRDVDCVCIIPCHLAYSRLSANLHMNKEKSSDGEDSLKSQKETE